MRKFITILIVVLLSTIVAQGQIKIGGNVYGGGNHANVEGSTKVTVASGDIGAVMNPNAKRPLCISMVSLMSLRELLTIS